MLTQVKKMNINDALNSHLYSHYRDKISAYIVGGVEFTNRELIENIKRKENEAQAAKRKEAEKAAEKTGSAEK